MRRIWARANPNAPSDSEEDEEDKAGIPDHVSVGSKKSNPLGQSYDDFDELIAEEGIKPRLLSPD